jgi:hypothetical protein
LIVTPDFVFLNNPRTGTTFARKAITAAYSAVQPARDVGGPGAGVRELMLPVRRGRGQTGVDHHGTFAQIPTRYRTRPVVSAVRNPFTLLVAVFELSLWLPPVVPADPSGELGREPPGSFGYFLKVQELAMRARWGIPFGHMGLGPLSVHHLQMFSREPGRTIRLAKSGASFEDLEGCIGPIRVLQQERLQDDLCALISDLGAWADAEAIRAHAPSHVTRRSLGWSHASFSPDLVTRVLEREAFLFWVLRRRGFDYGFDNADFSQPTRAVSAS